MVHDHQNACIISESPLPAHETSLQLTATAAKEHDVCTQRDGCWLCLSVCALLTRVCPALLRVRADPAMIFWQPHKQPPCSTSSRCKRVQPHSPTHQHSGPHQHVRWCIAWVGHKLCGPQRLFSQEARQDVICAHIDICDEHDPHNCRHMHGMVVLQPTNSKSCTC